MAKLKSVTGPVPLPRSEEEYLGGAPNAPAETRAPPPPDDTRTIAPDTKATDDDGLVAVTIRITRRMHDVLAARAAADERSIAQTARRLLAPLLE